MTDDKKPRTVRIIDKADKTDNPKLIPLNIVDDSADDLNGLLIEGINAQVDDDDDSDMYDPAMAGYDPRLAHDFDEEDAEARLAFLVDCAIEWLPELPQIEELFDKAITLEYTVLVGAKIMAEEMAAHLSEDKLDNIISAMLLVAEEDPEIRADYYDLLSTEAQILSGILDEALAAPAHDTLSESPMLARMMMFAGIMADVEVLSEIREDEDEEPAYEDLQHMAELMQTLSFYGDLPTQFIDRAQKSFNALTAQAELPLRLERDGGCLMLEYAQPTTTPPAPPKPPRR